MNNQYGKVRETGLAAFPEKGNRSASPHGLSISNTNVKNRQVNSKNI